MRKCFAEVQINLHISAPKQRHPHTTSMKIENDNALHNAFDASPSPQVEYDDSARLFFSLWASTCEIDGIDGIPAISHLAILGSARTFFKTISNIQPFCLY